MTIPSLPEVLSGALYVRPGPRRLVGGKGVYVADLDVDGCLEAAFARSWSAHGILNLVDISQVGGSEGILGAFAAEHLPDLPVVPPPPIRLVHGGIEHPALARDKVRYVGEPVAVVLAENRYCAEDAVESIHVDIEPLPAVTDPIEAADTSDALLFEGRSNVVFEHISGSDPDETRGIIAAADHVVDVLLRQERLAPTPLEGRAFMVVPEGEGLVVFCSHQAPHRLQHGLATAFDLPPATVRVIVPNAGGAFGQKSHTFPEYLVLTHLALMLRRPIRWVEDRRESFISATHGRGQTQRVRLAADADGRLLALDAAIDGDVGAYPHTGGMVPLFTQLVMSGPYRIPAISVTTRSIVTNTCPTAPYRGAGRPEAAYAVERALNLLAYRLDTDPIELRMKNFIAREEFPYETPTGALYDSGDPAALLRRALELSNYEEVRKLQRADTDSLTGIGVCAYVERSGGQQGSSEYAEVEALPDGRFAVRLGSTPTGQDHETAFRKLAAQALGVDRSRIIIIQGDTGYVATGTGSFASRSMQVGGSAVLEASNGLLEAARERAMKRLEVAGSDLEYSDGAFTVAGVPERRVTLSDLAADEPLVADHEFIVRQAFPTGAYVAIVQIDRDTGGVRVTDLVAVDDCGTVIDQTGVEGQVAGSIAQGIGQSLYEEFVYDHEGQPLTSSMLDYLLPTASEMPKLQMAHIVCPSPFSSTGAKGAGEAGCIGVPPAVANAIEDALRYGIERLDPPFTPEKVWRLSSSRS